MERRIVLILLDVVAVALAVLSEMVINSGGFILRVWGVRIGFRSPYRMLVWLAIAVLLRLILDRRAPLFGLTRDVRTRISAMLRLHVLEPLSRMWSRVSVAPGAEGFRIQVAPGARRRAVFATLVIGVALAILLRDQIRQPYSVPDHGDPLFSMWRIGWVNHQLLADPLHLFDTNIFYPERLTLTLSDPMILPALMAAPLGALGVHPVVVYNVLLMAAFWLSGVATYLLVDRLTGSSKAAFIAGLMFACYAYRWDHYPHLELQITHWIPLGLIALHLFVATGRWKYVVALALTGVAQLYSSMYYGVFFLVYASVIGAGLLAVQAQSLRRLALPTAAAAALAAALSIPLVWAFVEAQSSREVRPLWEIDRFSARTSDYLESTPRSAVWRNLLPNPHPERALFPGLAPLVFGALGAAPPFSSIRAVYAAGLLVTYDASRGFNGFVYPVLYRLLPPVRGLRAPARISVLVGLTLSIFAGFGAVRILRRCKRKAMEWVAVGIMAVSIVVDAWPVLELIPVWKTPPPIYEALRANPNVVLAELPVLDDPGFNVPFMYFSIWHWTRMVNGYSGYFTRSYTGLAPYLKEFPRRFSIDALRRYGVTHVTLNCGLLFAPCEETRMLMRQSEALRLIQDTQWEGGQVELYELAPVPATPAP